MKKYIPILIALSIVIAGALFVIKKKSFSDIKSSVKIASSNIGSFTTRRSCAVLPQFLKKLGMQRPIIDLTQERYKGIAILSGHKVLHPKAWEKFEHFSTYTLDEKGNIYLAPMPYISIKPTTFNLQKNIYKIDTKSGKISIFMTLEDVNPSSTNPYGIISLVYDCEDKTLWVSAIDESDYIQEKGVIYHIDVQNKNILQKIEKVDALTVQLLHSKKGKYLLVGKAKNNALYAYPIQKKVLKKNTIKLLSLPSPSEHIRKIKLKKNGILELQTIPFSYTLIAQATKQDRTHYNAKWDEVAKKWTLNRISIY